MILLRNLTLFFALFLPGSCATGVATGWLVGPFDPPRLGYPIMHFSLWVLPLVAPSLLAVPILHFGYRRLARAPERAMRRIATIATPLVLLGVHLAIFGATYWSLPLIMIFLLPGAVYGASFGISTPRTGSSFRSAPDRGPVS